MLGVSKQRVSELRGQELFPSPVAELEAGPVWAASSLRCFLASWARTPGRPRTDLNVVVSEELKRIPRGSRGSSQNELRMAYSAMRRHQHAHSPDRPVRAVLSEAMHLVRQEHMDYPFRIDWEWFKGHGVQVRGRVRRGVCSFDSSGLLAGTQSSSGRGSMHSTT